MSRPIEAILKSFIHHVIDLQNEEDPAGSGFNREFRILREKQVEDKNNNRFPMEEGKKEENIKKNRYKDILPRDDRRVKLKEIPGEAGADYINASFIDDVDGRRGYIAAQGPMPHTVNDFWRMLWQYKVEIVFMACRLKEDGKAKCEQYWAELGESTTFGPITVYTETVEAVQDHFIKRRVRVEKKGAVHRLLHFQYVGWPDHNVPSSPDALRRMIEEVRNHRKVTNIPMVVHCSAGCGRTGTICAIDFAWTLLDKGMVTEGFSMFEVIKDLREQRISMVQTPDQYEYTHMVMKSLCNDWLASFSKHDYENVMLRNSDLDDPEESYYNLGFSGDQSNAKEPTTSSGRPTSKDKTAGLKPAVSKKPDLARPKPEVTAPKPDLPKHKPQQNYEGPGRGGAGTPSLSAPFPPPKGNNGQGEFVGKGTAGRSALRQRSHPRVALRSSLGPDEEEGEGGGAQAMVYEVVNKNRQNRSVSAPLYENQGGLLYENHHISPGNDRLLPDGDYANEMIRGHSPEEGVAPALPSRQYKPEEVKKVSSSSSSSSNDRPDSSHRHRYNNIQPPTPTPTTPTQASRGNVHRTHQPIPINPPPSPSPCAPSPISAPRGGQSASPRLAWPQGQAVADSSSSSSSLMSSAVGSRSNAPQPRPGWAEGTPAPVKRDFPVIFSGGGGGGGGAPSPSSRPVGDARRMMQSGDGQKHVVAAPGTGHISQARGGKPVYTMERVPRVHGPRPEPLKWSASPRRNQPSQFL